MVSKYLIFDFHIAPERTLAMCQLSLAYGQVRIRIFILNKHAQVHKRAIAIAVAVS